MTEDAIPPPGHERRLTFARPEWMGGSPRTDPEEPLDDGVRHFPAGMREVRVASATDEDHRRGHVDHESDTDDDVDAQLDDVAHINEV